MSLVAMGQAARAAAFELAVTSTASKNQALLAMADELEASKPPSWLPMQLISMPGVMPASVKPC